MLTRSHAASSQPCAPSQNSSTDLRIKWGKWKHLCLQSCVQNTCGSFRLHQHRSTGTEPTPNQTQLKKSLEQFFLIKLKYLLIMVKIDFFLYPMRDLHNTFCMGKWEENTDHLCGGGCVERWVFKITEESA